jgi:hypothetical protein
VSEPNERLLSTEQLVGVLRLLKGADRAELKLRVADGDVRSAMVALGMDTLDAQVREVVCFDTPDLQLQRRGLVVSAHRTRGQPGDSVVKVRPIVPERLPAALRKAPGFGVEVDAMLGGFVCSGSMKAEVDGRDVKAVVLGRRPIRALFTEAQRAFYATCAPEGVDLGDLVVLGPVLVSRPTFSPDGYEGRLLAEVWRYPDGTHLLELSMECRRAEAFDVAAEARAFLTTHDVNLSSERQTASGRALELLAGELTMAAAGR